MKHKFSLKQNLNDKVEYKIKLPLKNMVQWGVRI